MHAPKPVALNAKVTQAWKNMRFKGKAAELQEENKHLKRKVEEIDQMDK